MNYGKSNYQIKKMRFLKIQFADTAIWDRIGKSLASGLFNANTLNKLATLGKFNPI